MNSALQDALHDGYGEAHFNAGGATPLLYASVLLHSQQFERAIAFLCDAPPFAEEAVHMAVAMQRALYTQAAELYRMALCTAPKPDGRML